MSSIYLKRFSILLFISKVNNKSFIFISRVHTPVLSKKKKKEPMNVKLKIEQEELPNLNNRNFFKD
jgi:hypothetical protein